MRRNFLLLLLLNACLCRAQSSFQLAPPLLKYASAFSAGASRVDVLFNQPGAEVYYTLDGNEPTEKSHRYTTSLRIDRPRTQLKIKAIGNGFLPSETVVASFVQGGKEIKEMRFTPPHESYKNPKPNILFDNEGGITKYGNGTWIGYVIDTVELEITLTKPSTVKKVLVDLLLDQPSWIFLPREIQLFYFDTKKSTWLPAAKQMLDADSSAPKQCSIRELSPGHRVKTDRLKLLFYTTGKIPEWHPGKGQHAWLFIDEVKVF